MIESIDMIRPGEYLMCARGPTISGTDARGNFVTKPDRTFEGTIVRVLAVSPPMILIRVFPMPCGDPSHDHSPYATPVQFGHMGWTRPPYRYVKEYMAAAKHQRPVPPSRAIRAGEISHKEFQKLIETLYETGANPDTYGDDDTDGAPTYE